MAVDTYKKEHAKTIYDLLSKGYSIEAVAGTLGIAKGTIYNWQKKHKDLKKAVEDGVSKGRLFWETLGIQGTVGQLKGFNVIGWIFNMKNRYAWKDRTDITSDDEKLAGPIVYKPGRKIKKDE